MRRTVLLLSVVLLAAACGGGDGKRTAASTSTSATVATTSTTTSPITTGGAATTAAPGSAVKLHVYNVKLYNSEESDNGFRVQVDSPASKVTVVLKGGLPSSNHVVNVCAAKNIDTHGAAAKCAAPSDGEAVEVDHGAGLDAIEVIQVGVGNAPAGSGDSVTINEVEISYVPADRSVKLRLPPIDVPLGASVCKDNGCNPFFELTPFMAGTVSATATWDGADNGQLTLESGDIAAHGYAATGQPYNVVATASGGPGISIHGTPPASESAVAFRNTGATPLLAGVLTITWP